MQLLIDDAAIFDVEFYGNELFLITKDPIYTPANMEAALKALEIQLNYLTRLLASWNYQPQKPPFDRLQSTYFTGAVVKVGPLRLSPAMLIGLILASIALLGLVAFILNSRYPTASG